MTRDEVLERLRSERAVFDAKVERVPRDAFESAPEGHAHSPKDVVVHVTAYEEPIIERLRAAERGETTALCRDRDGWERFNESVWERAMAISSEEALAHARGVFAELVAAAERLTDADLAGESELASHIDQAWLEDRPLWQLVAIDGFDHYPDHYEVLDVAAGSPDPV